MKKWLIYILFISVPVLKITAQETFSTDTTLLQEILVKERKVDQLGFKRMVFSHENKAMRAQATLAEVLSYELPLAIRQYGIGGSASTSVRGGNASHTQVLWNGITVNSAMLGQADLSQISIVVADEIALLSGGSPDIENNGALGGTIVLNNTDMWNDALHIQVHQQLNSLNSTKTAFAVRGTRKKLKVAAKGYYSGADFINANVDELSKNSHYTLKGIENDIFWDITKNQKLTLHLWAQESDAYLPSRIPDDEYQSDYFLRTVLKHQISLKRGDIETKFSYQNNTTDYLIKSLEIKSRHESSSWAFSSQYTTTLWKKLQWKTGLKNENQWCESTNYTTIPERNNFSIFSSLNYSHKNLLTYLLLRQDFIDGNTRPFIPSLGIDYAFGNQADTHIKIGLSKNYRYPTFNDLYWSPGGNPNLKNEEGYSGEAGVYNRIHWGKVNINADVTAFYSTIHNWIAWQPVSSFIWEPKNVMKVISKGIETTLTAEVTHGFFTQKIKTYYTLNDVKGISKENDKPTQLIYKPKHQASANYLLNYKGIFTLHLNETYIGSRSVTSDGTQVLPQIWLSSLALHYSIGMDNLTLKLGVDIQNISNTSYEMVAGYEMPGRYFGVSMAVEGRK